MQCLFIRLLGVTSYVSMLYLFFMVTKTSGHQLPTTNYQTPTANYELIPQLSLLCHAKL
jgi:hypothetical protein